MCPHLRGEEFRGSIGFIDCVFPRVWTEDEKHTLWRAADMIRALWTRQYDAAALQRSNEAKDKLLASISHELRTSLTVIVGLSHEIVSNRHGPGPDEFDELTGIMAVQSRELAGLVEDILVASRPTSATCRSAPRRLISAARLEMVVQECATRCRVSEVSPSPVCPSGFGPTR
jgi:signal transduction histidine kinase